MAKTEFHIPKLRFAGFADPWQKFRIIDVADYVDYRGKTPTKTLSGILLVTAKNIRQGFIDYDVSQEFISKDEFDDVMSRGKVQIGDVLITTEAPLGNVASIDRADIALAQRVIKYRGKQNILNNRFLKYRFLTSSFQKLLETKATGGTVQGIKGSTLHKLLIRISCDVNEQTKIGDFFQKIDQVIELQQKALETAQDYKKSMLQKMFPQKGEKVPKVRFDGFSGDWEEKNVGGMSKITFGGGTPSTQIPEYWEGSIPWIQSSDILIDNVLAVKATKFINDEAVQNSATKIIPGNSLAIVTRVGVGKLVLVDFEYATSQDFLSLSHLKYDLLFSLYSLYILLQEEKNKTQGTAIKGITKADLLSKNIRIPLANEEQQKVGAFFQKLDQQIEQYEKKLESYQQLKKAMLQRMFV